MNFKSKFVAGCALATAMLFASCGGGNGNNGTNQSNENAQEEVVKKFVTDFASLLKTNNADSIRTVYPSFTDADSLVSLDVANAVVQQKNQDNSQFEVKCGNNVTLIVNMTPQGQMTVESSKGLILYTPERIESAKKFGQWKDGLTDVELARRMNDSEFMKSFVPGIVADIKRNLKATPTGGCVGPGDHIGLKVTNKNPFQIEGSDYTISYVQRSYMRMMGQMSAGDDYGTRPGATLAPNGSKSYSVPNPGAMAGNEVSSAKIKWKLSDEKNITKPPVTNMTNI